jgi:hypothetical protein
VVVLAWQAEQPVGKVQLFRRRLAPGEVELQALGHQLLVGGGLLGVQSDELVAAQRGQRHEGTLLKGVFGPRPL